MGRPIASHSNSGCGRDAETGHGPTVDGLPQDRRTRFMFFSPEATTTAACGRKSFLLQSYGVAMFTRGNGLENGDAEDWGRGEL